MSRPSYSPAERWGSGTAAPFLWLVAFLLIGLPLGLVLVQAIMPGLFDLSGPNFTPSLSALIEVARSAHLARGVVNTVLLGIAGAVISTILGAALALDRLGASLHEAARLAGASPHRHLARVVLPLVGGAVTIAFGITAIRSLFELPMSEFLLPLAGPPLPVVIVNGFTEGRDSVACALALVALCLAGLLAGLVALFRRPAAALGEA